MIIKKSSHDISYAITDAAMNIWEKSHIFIPKDQLAYFRFQIDVEGEKGSGQYFFCHLILGRRDEIWYTLNDEMHMNVKDLTFRDDDTEDYLKRAFSARYYIFRDLLLPAIEKLVKQTTVQGERTYYLRSTFPLELIFKQGE